MAWPYGSALTMEDVMIADTFSNAQREVSARGQSMEPSCETVYFKEKNAVVHVCYNGREQGSMQRLIF